MKKLIFLALILSLVGNYLVFVSAEADGGYLFKDNGLVDRFGNTINVADLLNTHGWAQYKVGADGTDNADYQTFADGTRAVRLQGETSKNKAYAGNWTNYSAPYKNATFNAIVSKTAGGNSDGGLGVINVTAGISLYLDWNSVSQANAMVWSPNSPSWNDCNGLAAKSGIDETNGAVWNITFYTNGTYLGCSFNNTPCSTNCSFANGGYTGTNPLIFDGVNLQASQVDTFLFGDIKVFNGTAVPPPTPPETAPPSITYFNLTNENGCENWNTNKNTACNTSSLTPTVQFNTNENAWCAIAGSGSSTSMDLNYTDMGNSRNCTGTSSGEGATSHLCTLTSQDGIVYDTSYLFISCKDANNNQNKTSTSGALAVNVTGLETVARASIELGIKNSLSSDYAIFTDQKIYARNSANNQSIGVFDKVAKRLNKIWAFNRIGISDSYVNMFNITPILYSLEIANKTSAQITNQTELLINATK